ncbi:MAG: hypothetical protein L6R39_006519 [Caloplaca ligustica]|nr:MAG: hypothetical protein L6R39_006519 [Caloplaca ligustica]
MAILPRQYGCPRGTYDGGDGLCYRRSSGWSNWGRWLVLALIIIGAFFIFFAFACVTARRRRRRGMTPYRGTGWAAGAPPPGHAPAQYDGAQQSYYGGGGNQYNNQPAGQPAPVYSPPPNQNYYGNTGANQGYFGGQQTGVELQQPNNAYQPPRGGDQVFSPPTGPPPGKDGVVR